MYFWHMFFRRHIPTEYMQTGTPITQSPWKRDKIRWGETTGFLGVDPSDHRSQIKGCISPELKTDLPWIKSQRLGGPLVRQNSTMRDIYTAESNPRVYRSLPGVHPAPTEPIFLTRCVAAQLRQIYDLPQLGRYTPCQKYGVLAWEPALTARRSGRKLKIKIPESCPKYRAHGQVAEWNCPLVNPAQGNDV